MRSAVLYLRLSEADDASTSIARQEADLRARAEREGWRVIATLTDDGFSGRKARAKAETALSMIADHKADVLLVWKFDRWSRQGLTALADLIRVLEKREDALFIADRDGLSSDQPAWRIVASVLAEAAKMESDNTKLRVKSSIIALKQAHRFAGGTVPYGYRPATNPDGPGRILVLEPSEVVLINEMADRVLSGESPWRIANDLNERRTPAPRSDARKLARQGRSIEDADLGTWSVQSVKNILAGEAVVGRFKLHGKVLRDTDGLPAQVFAAALPLDRWHLLQDRLLSKGTGRHVRPHVRRARLLSGLVTCGECERSIYVHTLARRSGDEAIQSYVCGSRSNGWPCPGVRISANALENHVINEVMSAVGHWPLMHCVEVMTDESAVLLKEVENAIRATTAEMAADDANVLVLISRLSGLKTKRLEARSVQPSRMARHVPTGQTFKQAWDAADDLDVRRALLSDVVLGVAVRKSTTRTRFDPSRIHIKWPAEQGFVAARP